MKEKIEQYRKYIEYGIFITIMVVILLGVYTLFRNGGVMIGAFASGLGRFLDVISPIIYAFALAYILYRPTTWIEKKLKGLLEKISLFKKKGALDLISRLISIIVVFIIVGMALVLLVQFLVPPIIENIEKVVIEHPEIGNTFTMALEQLKNFLHDMKQGVDVLANPKEVILPVVESIGGVIGHIGGFLIDTIATIILTFYFLKDKERLFVAINRFTDIIFSVGVKKYVKVVLDDIDEILGGFIIGTILAGIIVGVISTSLMLMIGHPFAVLIGTVAGITNMIPYVGPIIGAILALVLGFLVSPKLGITGCILLLIYQQIDGNFIEPKVVGDKIGLSPVWILIVVIIGGSYYGGLGMVLSAPVAALIKVYIDRAYEYKMTRRIVNE